MTRSDKNGNIFFYSHSSRYCRLTITIFTIKSAIHLTLTLPLSFSSLYFFFFTQTNTQAKQRNTKNVDSHSTCDDPLCVRRLRATPKSLRRSPTFNTFYFVCSCVCVFLTIQTLFFMIQIV